MNLLPAKPLLPKYFIIVPFEVYNALYINCIYIMSTIGTETLYSQRSIPL